LYPLPWGSAASFAPAGRTPQGLLPGGQIMAAYPPARLEAPAGIDPEDELR